MHSFPFEGCFEMEIGNETRDPTMITFGLLGPQLGLVIWETVAELGVQAHHSAGVLPALMRAIPNH